MPAHKSAAHRTGLADVTISTIGMAGGAVIVEHGLCGVLFRRSDHCAGFGYMVHVGKHRIYHTLLDKHLFRVGQGNMAFIAACMTGAAVLVIGGQ